jgi:hypothetical protein
LHLKARMAGRATGEGNMRPFLASCQPPEFGLYKRYSVVSIWLAL